MILGLEDIAGGTAIVSFFIWLGLTFLFYLVCYVAALNVIDDLTKNSWVKIPAMWGLSVVPAGLMNILHYNPLVLFVLMIAANYFRVQQLASPDNEKFKDIKINKTLFYAASYGYIFLVLGLTWYFQLNINSS
ncbi:hypothetical protein UZ36_02595 [Candidatus Nitromaritima sp. SCGC AAA799-C22]|nr:hypothetical protein UZ36_02595 [Candidatus Nitromaritima sp. SCGC AAA799-C22]